MPEKGDTPMRPRSLRSLSILLVLVLFSLVAAPLSSPADAAQGVTVIRAQDRQAPLSGGAPRLLAEGTPYATPYYDHDSGKPGPTAVVLAGLHGNELAGFRDAQQLAGLVPKKGRPTVIPQANKLAADAGTRPGPHPAALTRVFPKSKTGATRSVPAKRIWNHMLAVQ